VTVKAEAPPRTSPFPGDPLGAERGGEDHDREATARERVDVGYSVSCTTRQPRPGEVDGRDYYFLSRDAFEAARARAEFAEWAPVHGNFYGTLRREVDRVLAGGQHVLMDIDIQGARQFADAFPGAVRVFVLPPSGEVLLGSLAGRGTEGAESWRSACATLATRWPRRASTSTWW
jgi:guanylate kinase